MSFSKGILTVFPIFVGEKSSRNDENIFTLNLSQKMDGILSFENRQLKLDNAEIIEKVALEIEAFKNLTVLELKGNTLGVTAGERLGQALRKHPELQRCLWSDMFTGRLKTEIPPILKSLCSAMIQANCHITELDLSDNAFGPIGADGISEFLTSPSAFTLHTLRLNNNGLGAGGVKIAQCLIKCHENAKLAGTKFELRRFIAGRNRLEDPGAKALSEAFSKLGTLQEVRIPQNGIRPKGISALAFAFEKNPDLQIIDINDNTCTINGAENMAEILPTLKNLVELDLGDCLCRDMGIMTVLAGLDGRRDKLRKVNFSGNEITPDAIDEIFAFFNTATMDHVQVNLSFNNFGAEFEEIRERVKEEKANFEMGDEDDDQGSLSEGSDEENEDYLDEEDEEYEGENDEFGDESGDTSKETVINTAKKHVDSVLDDMCKNGFGCMKIDNNQNDSQDGVLSFLDQKLKLDTAESAERVAQKIENTKNVRVLELKGNTIGVEAGERLAKSLEKHPELQRCLWSDMFTGRLKTEIPPVLKSLGRSMIAASCHIIELDLSDNAFGPIGAEGIKEFLESPAAFSLETLKLNNNGLGIGGKQIAQSLAECLEKSQTNGVAGEKSRLRLRTFIAGRNRLENPGAKAISLVFQKLETLENIQIPQNGINKEGIEAIGELLRFNRNLRVLNLNDNTATQLGAYAIAKNLQHVPHLEVLDLGDCLCRDQGCHAIIDALTPAIHRNLREVNLSGSELSPQAAQIIINKWRKFDNSRQKPILKIGSNNFGELFTQIRNSSTSMKNVEIGDSDDDCGSLSSDDEEYQSNDSENEESETEEGDGDDEKENQENIERFSAVIDELKNEYESRVQDESAKVLLRLLIPVQQSNSNPLVFERALKVAEEIIRRIAAVPRNPIPTTTQLINHFVAQSRILGVKPEEDWKIQIDTKILGQFLRQLLSRGHFELERQLILHYFA